MVTLYRIGTDTQTRCVIVTTQVLPVSSVTQEISGLPWQLTLIVPTTVVGVNVSGAVTSIHCVPTLSHPLKGQAFSPW